MSRGQHALFDSVAAEKIKAIGQDRAARCRESVLAMARDAVRAAALAHPDRTATADDAYRSLVLMGRGEAELGNAAGSIFRGNEWEGTGRWVVSLRTSNHRRPVRVWRLREVRRG